MKIFKIIVAFIFLCTAASAFGQQPAQNPSPGQMNDADLEKVKKFYELRLDNLKKQYTEKHPEVMRAEAELQRLKKGEAQALFEPSTIPKSNTTSPLTALQATVKGTFWRNPEWVKTMDLSADQQNMMDGIFHQYRLKLIDLTAALQKEEL